ncbi:hypothetical protein E4Q23_22690 [Candidatus Accumulibacter phosphatis]|uniref:GIY-YIG nuclease family protein n=1 Tax=Candidatus Accumulibacter phosphatis TaxID=327160 RepID=A0ABX1U1D7_9PROT|nr:hypothetical protein [Candidatus Accumulibacter phosphatis]NMQ30316.1 hypothetical protein [Candidatus Accumulibacter phosphatis]
MKGFEFYEYDVHVPKLVFVALDTFFEVHEAPHTPLKTLKQSWIDTKTYVSQACLLLGRSRPGHALSLNERATVLAALGEPPGPAWPLYFFTVGDLAEERIVYIGKTNAETHRFYAGHTTITALHRPEYRGLRTRLYLATVTIYSDEDRYIPLEWVHPTVLRETLWSDAEAQLIYYYQPELNIDLKAVDASKMPTSLTLHNYSGTKNFDAISLQPHREVSEDEWFRITN